MAWYDVFSGFYDASLDKHYREQRQLAAAALQLAPGLRVLDLPCGTGQSFAALHAGVAPDGVGSAGEVVGVDLSAGMLRHAQARIAKTELSDAVRVLRADAQTVTLEALGGMPFDRLHIFLAMSVFGDMEATFDNLWSHLAPGGRCVLVDVHNPKPGLQGHMVNWMARADIRRVFWEPLAARCTDFVREELPSKPLHGGAIFLAAGNKAS